MNAIRNRAGKDRQMKWENRIVGYGEIDPNQALANEANWHIHPMSQQKALSDLIAKVGLIQTVVINRRTSTDWLDGDRFVETVLDGHLRIALAISDGQTSVPVTYVDLSPNEERLVLSALDSIGSMAVADKDMLASLLNQVEAQMPDMSGLLEAVATQMNVPISGQNKSSQGTDGKEGYIICPECGAKFAKDN